MSGIGAETTVVDEWLEGVLAGITDVTGVWEGVAPSLAPYPFIVYQHQTDEDLYALGPTRVWSDCEYVIRAVAQCDSYADLADIANAIDGRLDGASGIATGGVVIGARRLGQYRLVEKYENEEIRHLGGRYRIIAQGS